MTGLTNREVAERLQVSEPTVKYHLNQVYSKLHVERREDLVSWRPEGPAAGAGAGAPWLWTLKPVALATVVGVAGTFLALLLWAAIRPVDDASDPPAAAPEHDNECGISSRLLPTGAATTCVDGVADLQALVAFPLSALPLEPAPLFQQAAFVRLSRGDAAYRAYDVGGRRFEVIEEPLSVEHVREQGAPLVISVPGVIEPPRGAFETLDDGTALLWWCPAGPPDDPNGPVFCRDGHLAGFAGFTADEMSLLVYEILSAQTYETSPGVVTNVEPTPVPFPPLRGERVEPKVPGVPLYPGAVEVDGFVRPAPQPVRPGDSAVQVFETADSVDAVLAWFGAELELAGWTEYGGSAGVTGRTVSFARNGRSEWVMISSSYVPRPEDEAAQPPPGFRGKGVPFASPLDAGARFWVVTWLE